MAMLSKLDYTAIAKLCYEYGYEDLMFAISAIRANKLENIGVSEDSVKYPSPLSNMKDSKVTNPTCKDCKYCGSLCIYRNPTGLWCGDYYPKKLSEGSETKEET